MGNDGNNFIKKEVSEGGSGEADMKWAERRERERSWPEANSLSNIGIRDEGSLCQLHMKFANRGQSNDQMS